MARFPCGTHHGTRQWINYEPCGLFCGSITYLLVVYGMYATTYGVIYPWLGFSILGFINAVIFNGLSLLTMYTHFKTMTTDPGAVPKDACPLATDTEEQDFEGNDRDRFKKFCRKCSAFKPIRAHHCSICGRCVVKMDHHCPWVNNCVGVGNHKLFLLFCFYVFVTCSYSMLLTSTRFLTCMYRDNCPKSPIPELLIVFLVIEGILFGLFTLCMIGDQMTVITTNQTQIDRMKNKKYLIQTEVHEVFGTPSNISFLWSWFIPVPTSFPSHVRDIILGFRVIGGNVSNLGEEEKPLLNNSALTPTKEVMMKDMGSNSSAEEDQLAEALYNNSSSMNALRPRAKRKSAVADHSSEESSYTGEDNNDHTFDLSSSVAPSGSMNNHNLQGGETMTNSVITSGNAGGNGGSLATNIEVSVPVTSNGDYSGNVRKRV